MRPTSELCTKVAMIGLVLWIGAELLTPPKGSATP
jgi:hypothetical protein